MLRRLRNVFRSCMPRCRKSTISEYEAQDPSETLEIGDIVGVGAFGKVYKGHHLETNDTVAIKVLSAQWNTYEEIKNEIQILKKYSKHENIVSFYGEYSQPKGKLWISMEYCGGGTVKDLITNTPTRKLPETWIAYIIREVLKALKYLHKKRVVHRDIKGANIALTEDASVRLIDFGISKKLKGRFDSCKNPVGTPHYFAPEVWKCLEDKTASYSCKCDIWSLGITAIEMAEGKCPGLQTVHCDPPTLKAQSKWSTEFNSFLGLCLEKNPKVRQSAEQLLKHPFVRDLQNVEMVRAEIQSQIYRVNGVKSKKVDVKPKEQPERISLGDFENAMAADEDLLSDNISFSNVKNLNLEDHAISAIVEGLLEEEVEPKATEDATDAKELASQAEIDLANTKEPASKGKKEASNAEKSTQQAEDDSCNGEITHKTEITATAASTGDQAIKILEDPSESKEGDRKPKVVKYKAMAIFLLLIYAVFLSGFVLWIAKIML